MKSHCHTLRAKRLVLLPSPFIVVVLIQRRLLVPIITSRRGLSRRCPRTECQSYRLAIGGQNSCTEHEKILPVLNIFSTRQVSGAPSCTSMREKGAYTSPTFVLFTTDQYLLFIKRCFDEQRQSLLIAECLNIYD